MVSLLATGLRVGVTHRLTHFLVGLGCAVRDLLSRTDLLIALTPTEDLVHRRLNRCLGTVGHSRALNRLLGLERLG